MFSIPARSPDLNPIKNNFHIVKKKLHQDALQMKILRNFQLESKKKLESVPVHVVDRTIRSMNKRIDLIVKRKGKRIRY